MAAGVDPPQTNTGMEVSGLGWAKSNSRVSLHVGGGDGKVQPQELGQPWSSPGYP